MAYACLSEVYDLALGMSRKGGEPTLTTCSKNHRFWRIGCDMGFLSGEEQSSRPLNQDLCLRLPDGSLFELQYVAFRVACINDEKRLLISSKIRDLAL